MNIDRFKYYNKDKYGNMLFNITRCFNDMVMAKRLINSIEESNFKKESIKISYTLYISKLYFGHLKESLKLLGYIYETEDFKNYFCTPEIMLKLNEISDEINTSDNSLNKKYLDIRHEAFHYLIKNRHDIKSFVLANKQLYDKGFNTVTIEIEDGLYQCELASDVLTLTKYFNCNQIPKEITILYDKVIKIIQLILTNISTKTQ